MKLTAKKTRAILTRLVILTMPITARAVSIATAIPVIFPANGGRVAMGTNLIPAANDKSNPNCSCSGSKSVAAVAFAPTFATTPVIITANHHTSNSSAVAVDAIATSTMGLLFDADAARVGFCTVLFSWLPWKRLWALVQIYVGGARVRGIVTYFYF